MRLATECSASATCLPHQHHSADANERLCDSLGMPARRVGLTFQSHTKQGTVAMSKLRLTGHALQHDAPDVVQRDGALPILLAPSLPRRKRGQLACKGRSKFVQRQQMGRASGVCSKQGKPMTCHQCSSPCRLGPHQGAPRTPGNIPALFPAAGAVQSRYTAWMRWVSTKYSRNVLMWSAGMKWVGVTCGSRTAMCCCGLQSRNGTMGEDWSRLSRAAEGVELHPSHPANVRGCVCLCKLQRMQHRQ